MTSLSRHIMRHVATWWRHQMETFPRYLPFVRSFYVFFDLRLNKRLSKQTSPRDLRHHRAHYDVTVMHGGHYQGYYAGVLFYVKSLQLIWRSGIRRFHLRVPDLKLSCNDLTRMRVSYTSIITPGVAAVWHCFWFHLTFARAFLAFGWAFFFAANHESISKMYNVMTLRDIYDNGLVVVHLIGTIIWL